MAFSSATTQIDRKCAYTGCVVMIQRNKILCVFHWELIPPHSKQAIGNAILEKDCAAITAAVTNAVEIVSGTSDKLSLGACWKCGEPLTCLNDDSTPMCPSCGSGAGDLPDIPLP